MIHVNHQESINKHSSSKNQMMVEVMFFNGCSYDSCRTYIILHILSSYHICKLKCSPMSHCWGWCSERVPHPSLSSPRGVACGERGDSLVLRALCGSLGVSLRVACLHGQCFQTSGLYATSGHPTCGQSPLASGDSPCICSVCVCIV